MTDDNKTPIAMPIEQVKSEAAAIAREMKSATEMPASLRTRFINVRAALFQRGIYDPVLVRFDSATAPRATFTELAQQLEQVAANL